MPTETVINAETGEVTVREFSWPPGELERRQQREADRQAREAARQARLESVPANENSLPAIRDKVNQILELLRGEV